jgi:hypothetical protein
MLDVNAVCCGGSFCLNMIIGCVSVGRAMRLVWLQGTK